MKRFEWNEQKNQQLKQERGISFEQVIHAIESGDLLDIVRHPNPQKYQNQFVLYVKITEYVYVVPFVETDEKVFLKTIFPSRKATKKYLGEN